MLCHTSSSYIENTLWIKFSNERRSLFAMDLARVVLCPQKHCSLHLIHSVRSNFLFQYWLVHSQSQSLSLRSLLSLMILILSLCLSLSLSPSFPLLLITLYSILIWSFFKSLFHLVLTCIFFHLYWFTVQHTLHHQDDDNDQQQCFWWGLRSCEWTWTEYGFSSTSDWSCFRRSFMEHQRKGNLK